MEIQDILIQAQRMVDEAGIQQDLRQAAFSKAVDLIARGAPGEPEPDMPGKPRQSGSEASSRAAVPLGQLAARLRLDLESVRHVYDIDENGDFHIVVGTGKLDKAATAGTKQLALLVAAGRQGSGLDGDWTSVDEVRKWADQYKRLNSANFASTLKDMENEFSFRGTARKRELRLSKPGWERATALVEELAQVGESRAPKASSH